ncbi:MAG: aldolase, partial [Betaproteobacteria bacterium]|nr:aldolase [Betaproteobacteria bacterium]
AYALLLAHHGPVVAGASLEAAADTAEELEQTAAIHFHLHGKACRCLSPSQRDALLARFPPSV